MLQSTGWKKGFGHNQQGTTSPVEVSLPFLSKHNDLQPVMSPKVAGGSSQLERVRLQDLLDGIIHVH